MMNGCPGQRSDTPSPNLYYQPVTLNLYTGQTITTPNNPNGLDIAFSDLPNESNWAYSIDGVHGYYWSQSGVGLCWWAVAGNGNNFVRFSGVPTKGPLGPDGPGVISLYSTTDSSGIVNPADLIVSFVISDLPTPQITSTPPVGIYQQSYSYKLTVGPTNTAPIINPVFSNYTNLPGGLTGSSNGLISGIPLKIGPRTFKVHITCQGNPTGVDAYQTISIIENPPVVGNIKISVLADHVYSVNISATPSNSRYTYALEDNPAWIMLSSSTSPAMTISPTGFFPCDDFYVVKMKAFNTNPTPGIGYLEVTVTNSRTPELAAGTPPPDVYYVGDPMTFQVKARGCVDSITLDPSSAALPTGMVLSATQGSSSDDEYSQFVDIAGTPTATPNLYPIKLRATRTIQPAVGTGTFSPVLIYRKPEVTWPTTTYEWLVGFPGFTTPAIPAVNTPIASIPQVFNFTSTDLAALGLSMNSADGAIISGTPAVAFNGTVGVVCSNSSLYPLYADPQGYPSNGDTSGVINLLFDTAANLTPVITSEPDPFDTDLPWEGGDPVVGRQARYATGIRGTPMSYQIVATHQPTAYSSTALPAGLTLNTTTGLISGTPTVVGLFDVTVSATNMFALTGQLVVRFLISYPAPVITSPLKTFGVIGEVFDPPSSMGGQPPAPAGYHITATIQDADTISSYEALDLDNVDGLVLDTITGVITGTPTVTPNVYSVTLVAHNTGAHVISSSPGWTPPPALPYTVPAQEPSLANGGVKTLLISIYGPRPTITSVTPVIITAAGTTITITGTNYVPGATVLVGSLDAGYVEATSVNVVNDTEITAIVGALGVSDTGYDVVVINPDGQSAILEGALFFLPPGASLVQELRYTSLYTGQNPIYNVMSTGGKTARKKRILGLGTNVEVVFYSGRDIAGNKLLNIQRKMAGTTSTRHAPGDLVFKGMVSVNLSPIMYKCLAGEKIAGIECYLRSNGRVDMATRMIQDLQTVDDTDVAYAAYHAVLIRSLSPLPAPLLGTGTCTET